MVSKVKFIIIAVILFVGIPCIASEKDDLDRAYDIVNYARESQFVEAYQILKAYTDKGNARAQTIMGMYYEIQGDYVSAMDWYKKAEKQNEPEGTYCLACIYLINSRTKEDRAKSFELAKKAASLRYYGGYELLAMIYQSKKFEDAGITQDLRESARMFERAGRECNHPQSFYDAADLWYNKIGDFSEAKRVLLEAVKVDKSFAPACLASWFYYNDNINYQKKEEDLKPYKISEEEAFRYNRIAADQGDADAQKRLGDQFMEGRFVKQSFEDAIVWYKKATAQGEPNATSKLASCYESLFNATLNEKYLRQYLRWKRTAEKAGVWSVRFNDIDSFLNNVESVLGSDVKQTQEYKKYYDLGYLHASEYKDYESWQRDVVEKIAEGSDVDVKIPVSKIKNVNTYVLILANDDYQYEEDVIYADNDGEVFYNYCQNTLGIPDKNIHYIQNATLNTMKYEVDWLAGSGVRSDDSRYIFYYAGHGVPAENLQTSYLLPVDGYARNISTGYDMASIIQILGSTSVPTVMLLDACFSGTKRTDGMLFDARSVAIRPREFAPSGKCVVMSACSGVESALPFDEQQHGMFTYFLLKKLKESKGDCTVTDLFDYIKTNVESSSVTENGKKQTPSLKVSSDSDGLLDITLVPSFR